jgi:hypothetical protein
MVPRDGRGGGEGVRRAGRSRGPRRHTDVEGLPGQGLCDAEAVNVVLAARSVVSRAVDALGVAPEPQSRRLAERLRQAPALGRPLAPEGG